MTSKSWAPSLLAIALSSSFMLATISPAQADQASIAQGKKVAFDRKKGNCLACHVIAGGKLAGNIGPPLIQMQARFPQKGDLRAQIWNASKKNPNTIMPPFGKHGIMSEKEINLVTDFIYNL